MRFVFAVFCLLFSISPSRADIAYFDISVPTGPGGHVSFDLLLSNAPGAAVALHPSFVDIPTISSADYSIGRYEWLYETFFVSGPTFSNSSTFCSSTGPGPCGPFDLGIYGLLSRGHNFFDASLFVGTPTGFDSITGTFYSPPIAPGFVMPAFVPLQIEVDLCCDAGTLVALSVPEPSTWTMMILGFCGIVRLAYGRRKAARVLAASSRP